MKTYFLLLLLILLSSFNIIPIYMVNGSSIRRYMDRIKVNGKDDLVVKVVDGGLFHKDIKGRVDTCSYFYYDSGNSMFYCRVTVKHYTLGKIKSKFFQLKINIDKTNSNCFINNDAEILQINLYGKKKGKKSYQKTNILASKKYKEISEYTSLDNHDLNNEDQFFEFEISDEEYCSFRAHYEVVTEARI